MEAEDVVTFCQHDLPCTSFAAFADMRRSGELCDLTINVHDYSFTAHRVILAAGIPYFRSVFTRSEADNEGEEIYVGDLDPLALGSLIDFAYSSRLNISVENVHSLLQASQFLQLKQVLDACVEFLSKRLHVNNVLHVHTLAHSLNNLNLIENSNCYIRQNFEELSKSGEFLRLPQPLVKEIISHDDLNVSCEEIVFETVVNWVKVCPSERHAMLPELLSEVRMIYLPVDDYLVTRVESEELIRTSTSCRDLVNEVKNYQLAENKSLFLNLKTQPRKFQSPKYDTYAICYNDNSRECSIYCCDFTNETWINVSSKILDDPGVFRKAVAVNDKIYFFLLETIQTMHLKTLEWEELKARHRAMENSSILSHGSIVYCFGSNDVDFQGKIRSFDTVRNHWLEPGLMKTPRWGAASASLGELIYVTGGAIKTCLSVVEKYDPSRRQWTEAAPMLTTRRSHGCVTLNGKIFVCGGRTSADSASRSCTAEVYDPLTDTWNFISSMMIKRSSLSLISSNKKIFALGGYAENNLYCLDAETYDPESDQWNSSFSVPRNFKGAVTKLSSGRLRLDVD